MAYPGYAHRQHYVLFPGKQELVPAIPFAPRAGMRNITGHYTPIFERNKTAGATTVDGGADQGAARDSLFWDGEVATTKYGTRTIPFSSSKRGNYMLDYGKLPARMRKEPTRHIDLKASYDTRTTSRTLYVDPSATERSSNNEVLPRVTLRPSNKYAAKMSFAEITQQGAEVVQIQTHGTTKDVVGQITSKVPERIITLTERPDIKIRKDYDMSWYPHRTRATFCDHQRQANGVRLTMMRTGIKSLH